MLDSYSADVSESLSTERHANDISSARGEIVVGIGRALFTWSTTVENTRAEQDFVLKIEDEIEFYRGGINLIVGPTGKRNSMLI